MTTLIVLFALAAPDAVAVPAPSPTRASPRYMVGEGWGCVAVVADRQTGWECWQTPAIGTGAPITAARVPWPSGSAEAGPDRICTTTEQDEVRCFEPPRPGDKAPKPRGATPGVRAAGAPATGERSYLDKSALYPGLVGGTFACPSRANDIWCAGDNSFGQLGTPGTPPTKPPLLKLWITQNVGLGTWHACAWRGGGPPAHEGLFCWGRGDAGQLGIRAPDICNVGGKDVACARAPTRVPTDFRLGGLGYAPNRGKGDLRGGDRFTCARRKSGPSAGIACWGASRDGLFGSAALCPPGFAKAWPTRRGATIAAPRATCSPTPVTIPGSDRFKVFRGPTLGGSHTGAPEVTDNFDVGPRGLCMVSDNGDVWCTGALASPRGVVAGSVIVSPGDNASACADTKDGLLFCWGEGYSPPNAPDRAVAIELEPLPPPPVNPNPGPVDTPVGSHPWGKSCSVHRACEKVARTIEPCAAGRKGLTVDAAAALPADGRVVSIEGPLGLGYGSTTLAACSERDPLTDKPLPVTECCNHVRRRIVVGEDKGKRIALEKLGCSGDESRVCCDLVVRGQTVVVTGKLVPDEDAFPQQSRSMLAGDVKLCAPASPPQP